MTVVSRKGEFTVDVDEQPGKGNPEKIPQLRAAFAKDGRITAATSSSISDGAAALVLTRQSVADKLGKTPVARVVAHAAHAQEPAKFTSAPGAGAAQGAREGRVERRRRRSVTRSTRRSPASR